MTKPIAVYGGGGFARHVAWLITDFIEQFHVACFIDDAAADGAILNDIPVFGFGEASRRYPDAAVVCAVAAPHVRKEIMVRVTEHGFASASIICPSAKMSRWTTLGDGVIISLGNIIDPNVVIGNYVHINKDCTIGHDVIMEDYVTVTPGVHLGGYVTLEEGVYVGIGAVVLHGTAERRLVIGAGAVVGGGACVTRSVPAGATVVGVPARPLPS